MLKKKIGNSPSWPDALPAMTDEGDLILQPDAILDARWAKHGSRIIEENLVQWKQLPKEDATWKNAEALQEHFGNLNLADKVPKKGGDNDKP